MDLQDICFNVMKYADERSSPSSYFVYEYPVKKNHDMYGDIML